MTAALLKPLLVLFAGAWAFLTLFLVHDKAQASGYAYPLPSMPQASHDNVPFSHPTSHPAPLPLPHHPDPVLPAGYPDPMNRDYYANPNNIQGLSPEQAARLVNPAAAREAMAREAAGESNRIIAMSVYGSDPEYWLGAVDNARLVKDHWAQDGWRLRLYHDDQVPQVAIHLIRSLGAETILMRHRTVRDFSGNLWRFLPLITDPTMTRLILRDVDGRLTHRDLEATREWIASEKPFHVMRDNHQHAWPVMAGMWGVVGGFLNADMLEEPLGINPPRIGYFGDDQTILREVVWPHVTQYTLGHDSYTCEQFGLLDGDTDPLKSEVRGFPTQRLDRADFIGNTYRSENEMMGVEVAFECPMACRRRPEWTWC